MKDFAGVVDMQAESLLGALQRQQTTRCQEISNVGNKRAKALLKAARRQCRIRMRQAVAEERQRIDAALLQARGRIRTRKRMLLQQQYKDLLKEGWALLEAGMQARWENAEQRRAWCESLAADALAVFGNTALIVEHPAGWRAEDQAWLAERLRKTSGGDPAFKADENIRFGLRISTGNACLDGTLGGLLADRRGAEAVLLAAWERSASELTGHGQAEAEQGHKHE